MSTRQNKIANPILFLLIAFICISIFSSPIFAVEDEDEQYPTVSRKAGEPPAEKKDVLEEQLGDIIPTLVRKKIGKLKVDVSASMVSGYDGNVNLERYDEDGSFFMQHTLGISGTYPFFKIFTLKGGYDFTSIKYFKFSDPDLLDNVLTLGLDTKIADNFLWNIEYMADFVNFPHDEQSKYIMNQIATSFKHDINDWLYQKIGFEYFIKKYDKSRVRNAAGILLPAHRRDERNAVFYQLGAFIGDKTFVKSETKGYLNDSNEKFLDYYDYRALKTKVSVAHLMTDKLYGLASFAYQYKGYNKRGVSDNEFDQRDHLFIYGASIFYDVIPSVSIGTSFDFRKNHSNENVEKYEDYIISSGVYCTF